MSLENDILRLLLLENYMPSAKSEPKSESHSGLEAKYPSKTHVAFRDRIYETRKFGNKIWMIDNLDLSLRSFGSIEENSTRSENGIKYYTWNDAMEITSYLPGWHLPSAEEWRELDKYRTRIGLDLFNSEFNLFPTGYNESNNTIYGVDHYACFWTSDKVEDAPSGVYFNLDDNEVVIGDYPARFVGRCVRLVKDD